MKSHIARATERVGVAIAQEAFEVVGFAFREQQVADFGIDSQAELIESGSPTGRLLGIQLKAGPSYFSEANETGFVFRTDSEHATYWCGHALPVLICLCDIDERQVLWQIVNDATLEATGKGYKITVPKSQKVDAASADALRDHLTPIVAASRYTIVKTSDVSHAGAKRYSFGVVINGSATKAEIAAIVRQVTATGQKCRYTRNDLVKGIWGELDAHVVWTYVYPTTDDHRHSNAVCRSLWISEELSESMRPLAFDGENIGDGVIVAWNQDYSFMSELTASHTLSKEEYLRNVDPLIARMEAALDAFLPQLRLFAVGAIDEARFLNNTEASRAEFDVIYRASQDHGFAPYECEDMNLKFQTALASLHNIVLFFGDDTRDKWTPEARLYLAQDSVENAQSDLDHLRDERAKAL